MAIESSAECSFRTVLKSMSRLTRAHRIPVLATWNIRTENLRRRKPLLNENGLDNQAENRCLFLPIGENRTKNTKTGNTPNTTATTIYSVKYLHFRLSKDSFQGLCSSLIIMM